MRLKNVEGPLSVYNGNSNLLNSPKRINTLQNSNVTSAYNTSNLNSDIHNSNGVIAITTTANVTNTINASNTATENLLNNINNTEDPVQWCNPARTHNLHQIANNVNNRHQLFNINNTLAVSLSNTRHGTASSICSESSPDDSLLDYEDAHQSCSSVDTSPQEEDRGFDISDSESISDEVNLTNRETLQPRGIVNPNYPGFQHFAHTLDYSLKASSDTDFTDDDFDCESTGTKFLTETTNNINNNNNNNEETEYPLDKIDSVNRLDSVENIQKVFYDKPVFNIPLECENLKRINCDSEEASTSNSNQVSDDDLEITVASKLDLNIPQEEKVFNCQSTKAHEPYGNIIGDFGKEVEQEFGRISRENNYADVSNDSKEIKLNNPGRLVDKAFSAIFEPACAFELEEAVEKLSISNDLQPTAAKYNIQPNDEQPFNKCSVANADRKILEDSKIVKLNDMSVLSVIHNTSNELKRQFPVEPTYNENLKMKHEGLFQQKLKDAFLSNVQENIPPVDQKLFVDNNSNKQEPDTMEVEETLSKEKTIRRDSNRKGEIVLTNEPVKPKLNQNEHTKQEEVEKFCKEDKTKDEPEKDEDSAVPRKKEKMEINFVKKKRDYNQQIGSLITIPRRELGGRSRETLNRRSVPTMKERKRANAELFGSFDVYNIETAMPKIDLEAIESHLRAAREEERRKEDMLENLLTTIKFQANSLSDNFKSKSRRIAMNFTSLKRRLINKESKGKTYYTVSQKEIPEYYDNDYLSPRACSMNYSLQWPSINDNMEWVPYMPSSLDEHNILDRFIKVITVNDENRRTDREEIRRRLAMGSEDDYYNDRPGRKPSLQARLQSGMNLQICFMNETVSDNESPSSDSECSITNPKQPKNAAKEVVPSNTEKILPPTRPATLSIGQPLLQPVTQPMTETDFFARQARLQTEARMALAQAKEMARMQMEIERQRQKKSPITEMVRHSLEKVGIPFPEDRRRLSRHILTEMNVAQLQVIVNDLHTQIETLNENLVKFLMDRDDLHMEQDSMLVDIEDLTRYLGAKEQSLKEQNQPTTQNNNIPPPSPAPSSPLAALNSTVKPHLHRIASLVKK